MSQELDSFQAAAQRHRPEGLVVLGSGMGDLAAQVQAVASVPFTALPGVPASGVVGHRGRLTLGRWAGRVVLLGEGRLHYYEGHPWEVVTRPVEFAAGLGIKWVMLTNAAGGIREDLGAGSLMPLCGQIEWNEPNPWRLPARESPYSAKMLALLRSAGEDLGVTASPGVYAAVSGPSYETPAEIRALRSVGADAVGMSTSREARAAAEKGLEVGAVSLVTNRAAGLSDARLDHAEVLAAGRAAAQKLGGLIERVIGRLG